MRFLFDENLAHLYREQLSQRLPDLEIRAVGEVDAPELGTLDPELLLWREVHGFILVTGDRASMPVHLAEHLALEHHLPGVLTVRPGAGVGVVLDTLELIATAATPDELLDRILYIPL